METSEIYKLQSAIDLSKARAPLDMIKQNKAFKAELVLLFKKDVITQDQIDSVKFPSWEKREAIRAKMREALLSGQVNFHKPTNQNPSGSCCFFYLI